MDPDTYPLNLANTIDLLCVPQALGFIVFRFFWLFAAASLRALHPRRVRSSSGDPSSWRPEGGRGYRLLLYYYPLPTRPGTHRVLTSHTHDTNTPGGEG